MRDISKERILPIDFRFLGEVESFVGVSLDIIFLFKISGLLTHTVNLSIIINLRTPSCMLTSNDFASVSMFDSKILDNTHN